MRLPRARISLLVLALAAFAWGDARAASAPAQMEVTADKSLEWYQDRGVYVARGNAKAIRGEVTVSADILTAHKRDDGNNKSKGSPSGEIDRMTAEGSVLIEKPGGRITGDKAVDDVEKHVVVVTGENLRYETDKQVVTAKDSLEYWDEKKIAVARGSAVAVQGDRHVKGDVLTAEFRASPNGNDQLQKMTAVGNVTVITKSDVVSGDKGVYDAARDIAIITGNVKITRPDGTELSGDVAESDFRINQSRLLNQGSGRVRALLPSKSTPKTSSAPGVTQ